MSHYAKLENSPRLQRMYNFLVQRGAEGATTIEVDRICNIPNPGCAKSELVMNGIMIDCQYEGVNENGRDIYRYKFIKDSRTEKVAA